MNPAELPLTHHLRTRQHSGRAAGGACSSALWAAWAQRAAVGPWGPPAGVREKRGSTGAVPLGAGGPCPGPSPSGPVRPLEAKSQARRRTTHSDCFPAGPSSARRRPPTPACQLSECLPGDGPTLRTSLSSFSLCCRRKTGSFSKPLFLLLNIENSVSSQDWRDCLLCLSVKCSAWRLDPIRAHLLTTPRCRAGLYKLLPEERGQRATAAASEVGSQE